MSFHEEATSYLAHGVLRRWRQSEKLAISQHVSPPPPCLATRLSVLENWWGEHMAHQFGRNGYPNYGQKVVNFFHLT